MRFGIAWYAGLAIVMLFLAGCSSGGLDPGPLSTNRAFNGGTQGVVMDFMSNAPPPVVFDTSDSIFDISLRLQNLGEFDVPQGEAQIQIIGIDPNQFGLGNPIQAPQGIMYGVKLDPQGNTIPGTIMTTDFFGLHWTGNPLVGSVPYSLSASLCYHYMTNAIGKICLKPDLLSRARESDICDITRTISPESSGAPVRVEVMSQSAVGRHKLSFSFRVRHVGTGEIFVNDGGAPCDDSLFSNEDKVHVTVGGISDIGSISCPALDTNGGFIKLFDGEAIISCTLDGVNVNGNFERAVDISVDYNYREIETTSIMVRHVAQ